MHMRTICLARCLLITSMSLLLIVPVESSDNVNLSFNDGRVTVVASEVPILTILETWARLGNTRFVNVETLVNESVSISMVDVPEQTALRVLLRAAAGYVVAPKTTDLTGLSSFDKVLIMASGQRRQLVESSVLLLPEAQQSEPTFTFTTPNSDVPITTPHVARESGDEELDELELLNQLRNSYQAGVASPDLSTLPSFFETLDTPGNFGSQTTPRPGTIISPDNERNRERGRPRSAVGSQANDP